jgi:hypothetical protein
MGQEEKRSEREERKKKREAEKKKSDGGRCWLPSLAFLPFASYYAFLTLPRFVVVANTPTPHTHDPWSTLLSFPKVGSRLDRLAPRMLGWQKTSPEMR